MKAAVLYGLNQSLVVEDIELEGPKEGEIVVKVEATGMLPCGLLKPLTFLYLRC